MSAEDTEWDDSYLDGPQRKSNILVLGQGARESALARRLDLCADTGRVYTAPGNGTTAFCSGGNLPDLDPMDFAAVRRTCEQLHVKLLVVGPEMPLIAGIADEFYCSGISVFGPDSRGARLEGDKAWAKEFMVRNGIPTGAHTVVTAVTRTMGVEWLRAHNAPYVLKASGPAAGKGTVIVHNLDDAVRTLDRMLAGQFGQASETVVIEEFLEGRECSVFVITDGMGDYKVLPVARDYKRAGAGDTGPNTGGMGAVSPVDWIDDDFRDEFMDLFMAKVRTRVIEPTLRGLLDERIDYRGVIYLGLMAVGGDPYLLEYNVRFGDPEACVILPRIRGDLYGVMVMAANGVMVPSETPDLDIDRNLAAVAVVACAQGYPDKPRKGDSIEVGDLPDGVQVMQAGTCLSEFGRLTTCGGRVLDVVATAPTIGQARRLAYDGIHAIHFDGMFYRPDIAAR